MSSRSGESRHAPEPDWRAILTFLPLLESDELEAGKRESNEGALPHLEYSKTAENLLQALYTSGVVYSFGWTSWQTEAERLCSDPGALDQADLVDLRKLLVTHVRKDRFHEGHFASMLDSGHLTAVLRRIAELKPHTP